MASLRLVCSADPEALLLHAAAPFLRAGRAEEPLPLLAVRHAALRDEVLDRAARAGSVGWLGEPLAVFRELPGRIADAHAPLSTRERHVLLARLIEELRLEHLRRMLSSSRSPAPVDALIGDLRAERVALDRLESAFAALRGDRWERERDAEVTRLYRAYVELIPTLKPLNGLPRADGRDGLALAAEAVARRPEQVRSRLGRPFRDAEPADLRLLGLMDLRRGWRLLMEALRGAPFVGPLSIYLPVGPERRDPAELWEFLGPLADDVEVLDGCGSASLGALAGVLFGPDDRSAAAPEVAALAAPDADREVDAIARRIKRLIVEQGVPPSRILVATRQSNPYVPQVADALRRTGVPVSARLRSRLLQVPAVGAFLSLFRLAADGSSLRALLNLAESPYFDLDLDVGVLEWIGARGRPATLEAWEQAIGRLAEARVEEDRERRAPRPERAARAREQFIAFRETIEPFGAARPLSLWLELARGVLADEGLWDLRRRTLKLPGQSAGDPLAVDAVRMDVAGLRMLEGVLESWRRALSLDPGADAPRDAARWLAELSDALESLEIELGTPNQSGVLVVEASAALGLPRDHLFIAGMSGGAFPAEPPPRTLYTSAERARLAAAGLPLETETRWFEREQALFRALLCTARQSVHASYAYAGAEGQVQLPSAYFEELRERLGFAEDDPDWPERIPGSRLVPASPQEVWSRAELWRFGARAWLTDAEQSRSALAALAAGEGPVVEQVLRVAAVERGRGAAEGTRPERVHPHNGQVRDPALLAALAERFGDAVWSVSRLEAFGLCPWSFFAGQVLRLESMEEPEDDVDAATRGSVLHDCLEALHRRLKDAYDDEALVPERIPQAEAWLDEIIPEVVAKFAARGWLGAEELRTPRIREIRRSLLRYLRWEIDQNITPHHTRPARRKPVECEVVFGMDGRPEVVLEHQGRRLRVRGRIDRVDEIVAGAARGWRYVVDHKSGESSLKPVSKYEAGALLQLPIYMKVIEQAGVPVWGGGYQVIGECKRTGSLHPFKDVTPGGSRDRDQAIARLDAAVGHALGHVDEILAGRFPAAIPEMVNGCPPYCDFKDICRHYQPGPEGGA